MTVPRTDAVPRFDTLLLAIIAGVTLATVRVEAAWNPAPMSVRLSLEILALLGLWIVVRGRAKALTNPRQMLALSVTAAVFYPFAFETIARLLGDGSEPLEMLMLTSLQLAATVLAVFSWLPRLGGTSVLLSSFLLLFATTMSSGRLASVFAGIYGVLGLWWLMGAYWDRIEGALVASSVQRRLPVRVSVIGTTGLVLLLLAGIVGATGTSAVALRGFMPTSGGTRWHDPHARSGVGDGDAMVAAKEAAMSFGPVESELFLDSDMPTLYDMFNDMYGEPPKPKKKQERNIGLAPNNVRETEQQIAKTERSGREFSAVRRKVERRQTTLDDRRDAAMLYVVGRVPLHLALERFDTFDGRVWTHSDDHEEHSPIRLETENAKPWAYLMRVGSSPIHRGVEPHAVKIINLKTNRFPSPPQLTAVHLDKVDQPDFFGWTDDGVACMPVRDHIPQLTVVHLRSQGVNLEPLRGASFQLANNTNTTTAATTTTNGKLEACLPSWRQVEAVVERLRTEFIHDRDAAAPENCQDVVGHFLQAKRGPSYLFATTAAVLLRELGYETRLVTGFYARADRFDHRAGQTAVLAEDVHVWVEVNIGGRAWVAIEPTPGYEPPRESLTWQQRLGLAWQASWRWCVAHLGLLLAAAGTAAILWWTRIRWLERTLTLFLWLAGRFDSRRRVLWTVRLLEWRAWLAGHGRPRSVTLSARYGALVTVLPPEVSQSLKFALRAAERLLYAPSGPRNLAPPTDEVARACNVVERQIGLHCFRLAWPRTT